MKDLIAYKQTKETIENILPNASHTFYSLVESFEEVDSSFAILIEEKARLDQNKDVKISASSLYDAYELAEDCMVELSILVSKIGMEEKNGLFTYKNINEFINPSRSIFPQVSNMISIITNQFTDFVNVSANFHYNTISDINATNIHSYMSIHDKISKISSLIYKETIKEHENLMNSIQQIESDIEQSSMVYESIQNVSASYYVAIIPDVTIIDIGKTEKEAKENALKYVGNEDDGIEIYPCSKGIYHNVSNGNTPDTWSIVNGVITLPEEDEQFQQLKESNLIDEKFLTKSKK